MKNVPPEWQMVGRPIMVIKAASRRSRVWCLAVALLAGAGVMSPGPVAAAEATLGSLEEIVETVPKEVILALRGGAKREEAANEANNVLRTKVEGQPVTLKFKVDRIQKERRKDEKIDRIAIKAEDERVKSSVTAFKGFLWVHIDPADTDRVVSLKKGAELTISGKVASAKVGAQPSPQLNVDVVEAKVK